MTSIDAPFWSRWLGDFRNWRRACSERNRLHYVSTVYAWEPRNCIIAAYWCFEQKGRRSFSYTAYTQEAKRRKYINMAYLEMVKPWTVGAFTNEQLYSYYIEQTKIMARQ